MGKNSLIAIAVVLILLLGAGGWYVTQYLSIPEVEDLKDLLPSGAMVFVEINDLSDTVNKIKGTKLYALLEEKFEKSSDAKEGICPKNKLFNCKIKDIVEGEIMNAFTKEGVIAVYEYGYADIEVETPKILFITRMDVATITKKNLLEAMLFADKENKIDVSDRQHLGMRFKVADIGNGEEVAYIILRDVFVASNKSETIHQVIEIVKGLGEQSIKEDGRFQSAYINKSVIASVFSYVDIKIFSKVLFEFAKQEAIKEEGRLANVGDFKDILSAYGFPEFDYAVFEIDTDSGFHLGYKFFFDAAMSEKLRSFWNSTKLRDWHMITLMPQDTVLMSLNAYQENAVQYYDYMGEAIEKLESEELKQSLRQQREKLEEYFTKLGYDYKKEILSLIQESGFVFTGLEEISLGMPKMQGADRMSQMGMSMPGLTIPFPKACILIRVKDKDKVKEIIFKAVDNFQQSMQQGLEDMKNDPMFSQVQEQGVSMPDGLLPGDSQEEKSLINEKIYNGITMYSLEPIVPFMSFLTPSFCLEDDYLVLGLSETAIKDMIDTYKNSYSSFDSSVDFISFTAKIPEEVTGLFHINISRLAEEIYKLKDSSIVMSKVKSSLDSEESFEDFIEILRQLNIYEGYMVSDDIHFSGDLFINVIGF